MVATSKQTTFSPAAFSLGQRIHQAWKRFWLAGMGIFPTAQVSLVSPNPGEQAWYISPQALPARPMVVSLGLAENLSFDLAMVRDYRARVHGFDPTPASRAWVEKNILPADFHYHALAVAGHDGWLDLYERYGKGGKQKGPVFQRAPCRRLSGISEELGLQEIDVLKMDIEGSEYDVLEDALGRKIFPQQIAVEFHHRFEEIGIQRTRQAHRLLSRHDYQLAHLSPWAEEFLYIKQETS